VLSTLEVDHVVVPVGIDESARPGESPEALGVRLSETKASAACAAHVDRHALGADTLVAIDDDVLGKPHTPEAAATMLRRLSGRTHRILTGIALASPHDGRPSVRHRLDTTLVTLRPLDEERIQAYVASGEPLDKAGAYAAQGLGSALVEHIDGDFWSVVGLPAGLTMDLLDEAGIPHGLAP
jgi:septum formation protein